MQVDEHHFLPLKSAGDPFFFLGDVSWHLKFNRPGISASGTEAEVARVARRVAVAVARRFLQIQDLGAVLIWHIRAPSGRGQGCLSST